MTEKTQTETKKSNLPSHNLCATDNRFGNEFTVNIGSYWEKPAKKGGTYGFISVSDLYLKEHPSQDPNQPAFQLFVKGWFKGKEQLIQIGLIDQKDDEGLFKVNHFELVLLPNRNKSKSE